MSVVEILVVDTILEITQDALQILVARVQTPSL